LPNIKYEYENNPDFSIGYSYSNTQEWYNLRMTNQKHEYPADIRGLPKLLMHLPPTYILNLSNVSHCAHPYMHFKSLHRNNWPFECEREWLPLQYAPS
jgi:hypothetical protein